MHNYSSRTIGRPRQLTSQHVNQQGFTIAELLVSMTLGLMVTGMAFSTTLLNQFSISKDITRTRLNQNIRGAVDLIGLDVRVAGENLNNSFPAIEVVDQTGPTSDRLILRRNLLEEVLPLCTTINAGSSTTRVIIARTTNTPGCSYSGQTHNFTTWQTYRTNAGGSVKAFLFDTVLRRGEFFTYTSGTDTGSLYRLNTSPINWANSYSAGTSAVYLLEEWEYRREDELIKLIENRDSALPYNVAFGINDLQISAILKDGTVLSGFDNTSDWTDLAAITVSVTGSEQFTNKTMQRTLQGRFFPRNVLSN